MDLKKISVVIEADGFLLHDRGSGIASGALLDARYEISTGWVSKQIEFEPDPRTLFHPFRRAMFVYTGEQPRRVLVRSSGSTTPGEEISDRAAFYETQNFSSYPAFQDSVWDQGGYSDFFFMASTPNEISGPFVPNVPFMEPMAPPPLPTDLPPDAGDHDPRAERDSAPLLEDPEVAPTPSQAPVSTSEPGMLLEDPEPNAY